MAKVTEREELTVKEIEGLYCSLQTAMEKVLVDLQYTPPIEPVKVSFFQKFFKKKLETSIEGKRYELLELLEALSLLKCTFEENMPFLLEGELYFRFKSIEDESRFNLQIGKGENPSENLNTYFEDLIDRVSFVTSLPVVSKAIGSYLGVNYCSALAKQDLGVNQFFMRYHLFNQ